MPVYLWIIIMAAGLSVGLYQKRKTNSAIRRRAMELESRTSDGSSSSQKEQ